MSTYYLTTAINYTNGSPHFGHAYEITCADIIARYKTIYGHKVYFVTGTDEHGQKIAETAKKNNIEPIDLCNKYVGEFLNLNQLLNISNNRFIRTTSDDHKNVAKLVWATAMNNGDIYSGTYTGWYNIKEEQFVTESEARKTNYCDPSTNTPLHKRSEPTFYFKLGKYKNRIIEHIKTHPNFILPHTISEEILIRLESGPLEDLSISRIKSNMDWGIDIDNSEHVMYVWFDALTNYLTGVNFPNTSSWPPSLQIIGKDISWFHAVIWSGMLMSIGMRLPQTILAHGFVNDICGLKMSKSVGNVIDPIQLLEKYHPDCIRMYLANLTNMGPDLNVSETGLIEFHDTQLAAKFSNLVHRCFSLTDKLMNSIIPIVDGIELFNVNDLITDIENELSNYNLKNITSMIFTHLDIINKYITDSKPWNKNDGYLIVIKTSLESLYIMAHFIHPFMPYITNKLFGFFGVDMINLHELNWNNLGGKKINKFEILFKQIETKIIKKTKPIL